MSTDQLSAQTIAVIRSSYTAYKLLLIHPYAAYRVLVIAGLLSNPPCPLYYSVLRVESATLQDFLTSLASDLREQSAPFGRRLQDALHQSASDPDQLAAALAADLADLHADHYLILLNDFDRADDVGDFQQCFRHLLAELPSHCHLLIGSRTLPPLPWAALIARHEAAVVDARGLRAGYP